ncbi:hypothetical protein, partial [Symbiobacterium terraclitae]|uniref:hypothetical protein n=1 Tax=Symbiobacterium terraclitae TaxID=557451 RepID=UPI0035B5630D
WQRRVGPINCSKCGRFVGKDGDPDVFYDDYNGGWEIGYPLCGRCLREKQARLQRVRVFMQRLRQQMGGGQGA